jgi:hypothetical protein
MRSSTEKDHSRSGYARRPYEPSTNAATLVFCGEPRRDSSISPPGEKLPRVNASRFQSGANCMHVVKLKRVAMQHGKSASRSFLVM